MTGRIFLKALLVAAISGLGFAAGGTTTAKASGYPQVIRIGVGKTMHNRRIKLGINKSVVVEVVDGVRDVLVSNPKVADAVVRSARRVYIMAGDKPGQTNVFLFGRSGRQVANFELSIELDTSDLTRMLRSMLQTRAIRASSVNGMSSCRVKSPRRPTASGRSIWQRGSPATPPRSCPCSPCAVRNRSI